LRDFLPLDTQALIWPGYHRFLRQQHPDNWEATADLQRQQNFEPASLIQLMTKLAKSYEIWYLHPSFGYYFEHFYQEPHGMLYQLKLYGTNSLFSPPLASELRAENEKFWTKIADQELKPILAITMPRGPGAKLSLVERCFKAAHLPREKNAQAAVIGGIYSRAINEWAVEVQKSGDLEKAASYFKLAQQLNPDNIVAEINLQYNKNLRAGQRAPIKLPKSVEDRFGRYRTWDQVLGANGPYDEPGFCYAQGHTFMRTGHYRQAAQAFDRVRTHSLEDVASRLWLAHLSLLARLPDKTLELTREIRDHPERFILNVTNRNELLTLEARAHFARNESGPAVEMLRAAVEQAPNDEHLLVAVTSAYFEHGRYSNALAVINHHLQIAPDNPLLLVNKGVVSMQANAYKEAIEPLTRALTLQTTNHTALFYRAVCYLRSDQLDAAQGDYETLQRAFPTSYQAYYGLGEIAYRRKDTNLALRYYEAYLTNAVPATEDSKVVTERLKELKGEKP